MRAMGRMIDQLGGEYITGEDVGTTLEDMEMLYSETDHVVTLPEHCGGAGDISPATALGSVEAMRACAERAWGSADLAGRRVALQGLGMVGGKALRDARRGGRRGRASPTSTPSKVAAAVAEHGVTAVEPDAIYDAGRRHLRPVRARRRHQRRHGAAAEGEGGGGGGQQHPRRGPPRRRADRARDRLRGRLHRQLGRHDLRHRPLPQGRLPARAGDGQRAPGGRPHARGVRDRRPRRASAYHRAADRLAERRIAALNDVRLLDRPDTAHYDEPRR